MSALSRDRARAYLLLFASGTAGLGYEIVWTRMLATGLGHEIHAMLAVVAGFFGGMGLGAWVLGERVRASRRPARWYVLLEFVIAAWALLLVALVPLVERLGFAWIGLEASPLRQWSCSFLLALVALLPATAAMGATLPALERALRDASAKEEVLPGLYAANTLGALAGLLVTTYLVAPWLGHAATSLALATLNVACALAAWRLFREREIGAFVPTPQARGREESWSSPRILVTLFATGLLGVGYEVLVVRVLAQRLENTVFTFANVLAAYLVGTALGAALYQRAQSRIAKGLGGRSLVLICALSCLGGSLLLPLSGPIYAAVHDAIGGVAGALLGESLVALMALLFPSLAMGATFAHLGSILVSRDESLGRALGANTLGATLAPALFGVLLLPLFGSRASLALVGCSYAALSFGRRPASPHVAATLATLILAALLVAGPATAVDGSERVLERLEGVMATVSVVEDGTGHRHLKVNDRFQMGGTASYYSDAREAHLPLLLHGNAERALFLGLGAGVTLAAAADHPDLETRGVELVPEVVAVMPHFESVTGPFDRKPSVKIHVADARRFVRASRENFDVIVADLFHPARDGAGALYTVEHFEALRSRLEPGGLICQWLPLYQMDLETLQLISRTFLHVFPDSRAYLAHYSLEAPIVGLVGRVGGERSEGGWMRGLEKLVADDEYRENLMALRIESPLDVLGTHLADSKALAHFAGEGALNTDDCPRVIYEAPRFAYAGDEEAGARLMRLVRLFESHEGAPAERLPPELRDRYLAYLDARDAFLHAGVGVGGESDTLALLGEARNGLLASVRLSPDFSAAYEPLLSIARRVHAIDPEQARALLDELEAANPRRPEARALRRLLDGAPS